MTNDPKTNEAKIYVMDGVARAFGFGLDGTYQEVPLAGGVVQPPIPGNGNVIKGDFVPDWRLQSASSQPTGGTRVGRYSISDSLIAVSFLLLWSSDMVHGAPSGEGSSRYYFKLPPEIPDISNNIAEHGSVRMFDGKFEMSGVPSLYNSIDRAVIAEVETEKWNVSTPFRLDRATQYISLGIFWIP